MTPVPPVAGLTASPAVAEVAAARPGAGTGSAAVNDVLAFDRAAAAPLAEVQAAAPPGRDGLGTQLSASMQDLSLRLARGPKPAATPEAAPVAAGGMSPLTQAMERAVAEMQGAYVFAIETTLASRGSTEATKVFNTLLKGQ